MRLKLGHLVSWLLTTCLISRTLVKAQDPWSEAEILLQNSVKRTDPIASSSKQFSSDYGVEETNLYIPMDYSLEREELKYAKYWESEATDWSRKVYQLLWESSNNYNNPQATNVLANMHLWSDYGIPHNKTLAYEYLNKYNELTNFSDSDTLFQLAVMHSTGLFGTIPVDPVKGLLYYQRSASLGDIRAKQALAYKYLSGINVPRDCNKALLLYREIADQVRNSYSDQQWEVIFPYVESYNVRIPDFSEGLLGRSLSSMALSTKRMASARPDITSSFLTKMNGGNIVLQFGLGSSSSSFSSDPDEDNVDRLVDIFFTAWDDYKGTYTRGRNCERARKLLEFTYREYDGDVRLMDNLQRFFYGRCLDLLGHIYFTGEGLDSPNIELSEKYLKRSVIVIESSQSLISRANIDLGLIQQFYYKNDTTAIGFYERILESKNHNGVVYFQLAKLKKKYPHLKLSDPFLLMFTACSRNYVPAIYEYARMTEQGVNKRYNCEETAYLYKNFLEAEEISVAPHLKTAYAELLNRNSEVALWAYTLAAEQGFETAHVSAAYLLYQLPCNFEEPPRTLHARKLMALAYYTRAFKQDNLDAGVVAGDVYYLMGNYTSALNMYQSASLKFSPQAIWDLGYMYEHGLGVEKDFHLAKRYYDQVLEHNSRLYFAVKLSVWKLKLKSWLALITGGKVYGWRREDFEPGAKPQSWYQKIVKSFQKAGRENSGSSSGDPQYQQNSQYRQHQEQNQQHHQQNHTSSLWDRFQSLGLHMEDLVSIAFVLLIFLVSLVLRVVAARRGWNMNNMQFQVNALGGNFELQVFAI
ncbi:hypothetical protein ZYGR_0U01240 [Zygosaccharomyces rouxii]|uniref:ZYRO0F11506p n=2 Tax=Zygosaccharomyces rouxii TaxID=4956 RepID=C5DYA5_ZYGRC|nr:uncharacterized protein ZYRO0F11506g [Zygosaccharomyces rouxii]KAH9199524.1 hypothetical protein LQ764DRAFT_131569 [Zygosaccharomyces rouxii]GAV50268.1 hypothetical protein ZYGR_0U01240 [Zygosaccharomyces rouxii]CAR28766.1 ZYRO0F11506p [Zygosaccharomyces rouxii]